MLALPLLLARPPRSLAILGNDGGTVGRAFGRIWPAVEIDGVEIDPAVSDAGRRFLGLADNPRMRVHDADARPFLRRSERRYDLVFVDAYHQPYVPFYLATREFFRLVRERLAPGGIVALNVATVPGDRRLERALAGTLAAELPEVRVWPVLRFNHLVLGFTTPFGGIESRAARVAPLAALAPRLERQLSAPVAPAARPWTDDRAPVEWITDRMIVEYAARGGRLDESPLPTAP